MAPAVVLEVNAGVIHLKFREPEPSLFNTGPCKTTITPALQTIENQTLLFSLIFSIARNKMLMNNFQPEPSTTTPLIVYLNLSILNALIFSLIEGDNFWSYHKSAFVGLSNYDLLHFYWLIASKSLLGCSMILFVTAGLLRLKRTKLASLFFYGTMSLFFVWLTMDLFMLIRTGNRSSYYLRFILDAAPWEWGGSRDGMVGLVALQAIFYIGIETLIIWLGSLCITAFLRNKYLKNVRKSKVLAFSVLLYLFFLLIPCWTIRFTTKPRAFVWLNETFSLKIPTIDVDDFRADRAVFFSQLDTEIRLANRSDVPHYNERSLDQIKISLEQRKNVILILLESVRADCFTPEFMPNLSAWAKKGRIFNNHYSCSNMSHLAIFSLLYGKSPLAFNKSMQNKSPAILCQALRSNGYSTSVIAGCTMRWQQMDLYFSKLNFDREIYHQTGPQYSRDQKTADDFLRLHAQSDKQQFLVVYLLSSHFDYSYPKSHRRYTPTAKKGSVNLFFADHLNMEISEELRQSWLNRYRNSVYHVDEILGQILSTIDLNKNYVIVTGDHGESFNEDGAWLHGSRLVSEIQTRVPFVLAGPGIKATVSNRLSSHIDFAPMILESLMKRPLRISPFHGANRLDEDNDKFLAAHLIGPSLANLVLIKESRWLEFRLNKLNQFQTFGFVNRFGRIDDSIKISPQEELDWIRSVHNSQFMWRSPK
jgi:hypothetical protein